MQQSASSIVAALDSHYANLPDKVPQDATAYRWLGSCLSFRHTTIENACMVKLQLAHYDLSSGVFRNCDMRGIDLTGANLRNACFEQCDLQGAILHGADLKNVEFHMCSLAGAVFTRTHVDNHTRVKLDKLTDSGSEYIRKPILLLPHYAPRVTCHSVIDRLCTLADVLYMNTLPDDVPTPRIPTSVEALLPEWMAALDAKS